MEKWLTAVLLLCLTLLTPYLWQHKQRPVSIETLLENLGAPEELLEHTKSFQDKRVVKVTENVYVAINFGVSNTILLVGNNGTVIVDTLESVTAAKEAAEAFRNITDLETKAVVYTHHHTDHVLGTKAFIQEGQKFPEVWAHELFPKQIEQVFNTGKIARLRARKQLGFDVSVGFVNAGIGGRSRLKEGSQAVSPTHFAKGEVTDVTLAGIPLQFLHMPGETADQISVWMPESRVLMVGDNIYKSFPNLYAIRGTAPRDVNNWINSLDKTRKLRPECIIGSHYKPLCGEQEVYNLLSDYMYGIQHVHDQTVRFINQGLHPDEIANRVRLPAELAQHPYLGQFYGNVPWSVKGIYISYLGWFSGFAEDLNTLTPTERAQNMLELVGRKGLLGAAQKALDKGQHQWALELASHIHRLDPSDSEALEIRRNAMGELASRQTSANGRNYYMTAMLEDAGGRLNKKVEVSMTNLPVEKVFTNIRMRLKAESIPEGQKIVGCFHFSDSGKTFSATIHKGVMEVETGAHVSADCSFTVTCSERVFKELIGGSRSTRDSSLKLDGTTTHLETFLSYLDK